MSGQNASRTDPDEGGLTNPLKGMRDTSGSVPRQSTAITTVVSVGAVLVLAASIDGILPAIAGLGIGVALALAIAVVAIDWPIRALLGGSLLLIAGGAAILTPLYLAQARGSVVGGLVAMAVLVGFGLTRYRIPAFGNGAIATALGWVTRVLIVVGAGAVLAGIIGMDIQRVLSLVSVVFPVEEMVRPTSVGGAMIGFVAISWLAYGGLWVASSVLPLSALYSGAKAKRVEHLQNSFLTALGAVLGVGSILLAVLYAVVNDGSGLAAIRGVVSAVVELPIVRVLLLRLFLIGLGITAAVSVIKYVGGAAIGARPTWLPSAIVVLGGLTLAFVFRGEVLVTTVSMASPAVGSVLNPLSSLLGTTSTALFLAVGALFGFGVLLALGPLTSWLGLLPARSAGPRLVFVGLAGMAVFVTISEGAAVVTFLGITAAIVAWDIGEHGASLEADLGAHSSQSGSAMIHSAASLLFGAVAFVGVALVHGPLIGAANVLPGTVFGAVLAVGAIIGLGVLFKT